MTTLAQYYSQGLGGDLPRRTASDKMPSLRSLNLIGRGAAAPSAPSPSAAAVPYGMPPWAPAWGGQFGGYTANRHPRLQKYGEMLAFQQQRAQQMQNGGMPGAGGGYVGRQSPYQTAPFRPEAAPYVPAATTAAGQGQQYAPSFGGQRPSYTPWWVPEPPYSHPWFDAVPYSTR